MARGDIIDEDKIIRNKDTGEVQWVKLSEEEFEEEIKKGVLSTLPKRKRVVIEKANSGRGNSCNNKSRQSYMSEPNVKTFNNAIREHSLKIGRPYAFDNVETLQKELTDYFDLCDKTDTVPTIVAIALYLGVNRDTIYAHANNPNSPYSDILKNVINYCHMTMENGALVGKINPVTYIFLGKNYFSLKDDKNITVTPSNPSTTNSVETMEAIQKQIEQETVPNADFHEG